MEIAKGINIGLLEGKSNWLTWKYKVTVLLRKIPFGLDLVEGRFQKPEAPSPDCSALDRKKFEKDMDSFNKADCDALLALTTNMTEDTLQKVMRFSGAKEVWEELLRLYDGISEDKAYDLCMTFFGYQKLAEDDVATHMSKLKNIWNNLKNEISKDSSGQNYNLPEIFLICKILGTLPENYFSFKSSWLLVAKADRTVENLTNQLCAFERALNEKEGMSCGNQEILYVKETAKNSKVKKPKELICKYCNGKNHIVRKCPKWKADGRPPKPPHASANFSEGSSQMFMLAETGEVLGSYGDDDSWFVDNGATNHVTPHKNVFKTFETFVTPHSVTTANNEAVEAVGKGSVEVEAEAGGKRRRIVLQSVWLVPKIRKNLFSTLSAQDSLPSSIFVSTSKTCKLQVKGEDVLVGTRSQGGGLYKLALKTVYPNHEPVDINSLTTRDTLQLYHERFGHQNKRHVRSILARELDINVKLDSELCEACMYGKAHRKKFGTRPRATKPGELIHTDVGGPFLRSLHGNYRYYVIFKDDFTKFRFVYFMREKSEVPSKLEQMLEETKVTGHIVEELLSDNGGEFDSEAIRKILRKNGIKQRLTMPYTPEQNGCSERENRTLIETARTLMHSRAKLPQGLWSELANTARYILNLTGPTTVVGKSPMELWTGKKPSVKHLKIIGSECYVHVPKQQRTKLSKKAVKGVLVGYENTEGYRVWCKETNRILRSRDVIFDEKPLKSENKLLPERQTSEDFEVDEADKSETEDDSENEDLEDSTDEIERVLRNRSTFKKPLRFEDLVMEAITGMNEYKEPQTYYQAVNSQNRTEWEEAMKSEMDSLAANKTWIMAKLPPGKKALRCRWVFRVKTNPDGSVDRYKARLVIKGFSQKKGIDYEETFSPVAKTGTIRCLLSVAANEDMVLGQFDVSTAFLYGDLEEEIFMVQPEGFEDGTNRVCHLKKSLYGLKQAPRCWNKRVVDYLKKIGFKASDADPCLFIRQNGTEKVLIALYVDDGLIAASSTKLKDEFLEEMRREFKITTKAASYFLGVEIVQEDGKITVNQAAYVRNILQKFGMENCKPVSTPMVKEDKAADQKTKDTGVPEEGPKFPYRQAVGALMYLMVSTRPDIAFSVGVVSRSLENPTESDIVKVKRIFRYLRGTADSPTSEGKTA
ncbi:unnamed protein product [Nesidiocoris tenuis]|uniref:Integrase catalytic domain-containing protein n=1 Tax=Nesidiocoris tenuis TaxID=355587 RepID=A0A6H5HNX5_9HEMI|nr:unnamed protein product [Nesidiocoris tenuis]